MAERPCLLKCETFVTAKFATQLLELSLVASSHGAETDNQLLLRLGMALEELGEWLFAQARGSLTAAADAWADRLYVLLGDAVVTGLPAEALFAEIHRSNMTKDRPGRLARQSGQGRELPAAGHKQGAEHEEMTTTFHQQEGPTMTKHRQRQAGKKPLWVFAQHPVRSNNAVIPIEAASRDEAIRIAEADPRRIGKPLTPKVVAGHEGFTDGQRDFVLFGDVEAFQRFLHVQVEKRN